MAAVQAGPFHQPVYEYEDERVDEELAYDDVVDSSVDQSGMQEPSVQQWRDIM